MANLSSKYSNANFTFNFNQCGDINYIWNSSLQNGSEDVEQFAYVEQAANVYVTSAYANSQADFPWQVNINNNIKIRRFDYDLLVHTLPHEFGHHFGLLHTQAPEVTYSLPPDPNISDAQSDHPYNTSNTGMPIELVIRNEAPTQTYTIPNHAGAPYDGPNDPKGGDLVGDTPATCSGTNSGGFPGCSFATYPDCSYTGSYVDYNGMPLDDPTNIASTNLMITGNDHPCRQNLTPGQIDRAYGYYDVVRKHQYEPNFYDCGNLDDAVEFEGTNIGIDRVAIKFNQLGKIMKALTGPDGDFDGILFTNSLGSATVTSEVNKLGSNSDFSFTEDAWEDGVTTFDLVLITKHLLGIDPLDGYKQVAADVNNSNTVTTFDVVLVRKLILQVNQTFPDFDEPWRFIPEFVTLNNPEHFDDGDDDNPFLFELTGSQSYQLRPNKQGFDGVKLGDVNESNAEGFTGSPPSEPGDPIFVDIIKNISGEGLVTFEFRVEDFEDISAYQMEIAFPENLLQYSHSESMDLAGVNADFFGTAQAENGIIRTLWYDEYSASKFTLIDSSGIFKLTFSGNVTDPNATVNLADNLTFRSSNNSSLKNNIAYSEDGTIRPIIQRSFKESNIVDAQIIPNPFNGSFDVLVESMKEDIIQFHLYNPVGQRILSSSFHLNKGSNRITLDDLAHLAEGIYILKLESETVNISKRIIKQR